jgi:hypothetical protein
MIDNAIQVRRTYNGSWRDLDSDLTTGRPGTETCLAIPEGLPPQQWRDPCDSLDPEIRIVRDYVCLPENYVDNDCDCCTPGFRSNEEAEIGGLESLLHWIGRVVPADPGTNLDPDQDSEIDIRNPSGDRRVYLDWDNAAELRADPMEQRILFTGYRLWRADLGYSPSLLEDPEPNDWQLMADLSNAPPDSLEEESPFYLGRFTNAIDSLYPVETNSILPEERIRWYYPIGRYSFVDSLGIRNGWHYSYDVTAYYVWRDESGRYQEISGRPHATADQVVIPGPESDDEDSIGEILVVPNPIYPGEMPGGTSLGFTGLPKKPCKIKVYTLAGDLVQTLEHDGLGDNRTLWWDLRSRYEKILHSGVYIYAVDCGGEIRTGRFAVVR